MGNIILYERRPDLPLLRMSNGMMSVFISTFSMAAAHLARTDSQVKLAVWIGCRDQSLLGLGCADFDVAELPWNPPTVDVDKTFLLAAADLAKSKFGWERLRYSPREDWALECLDTFKTLIAAFDASHIAPTEWGPLEPRTVRTCDKHRVFMHEEGCVVCNDR